MHGINRALAPPRVGADAQRAEGALDQDRRAELFREIVLPHLAEGLTLARWLAGNVPDAEDIVQEACLRALTGIAGFGGGSARGWVLAIVRNTAFSWLSRHRSKALLMVGDLADIEEAAQAQDPSPTPEAELIRRADARTVESAIAALPLPFREVLVLRDINGLSYKEIAELLNLPVGTVMSRLARGRERFATGIRRAGW